MSGDIAVEGFFCKLLIVVIVECFAAQRWTTVPDSCMFLCCWLQDLKFVGMMQYDGDLLLPANFLVPPPEIHKTSGEYLVHNGISTFACSETQKFGHVTFFWNGNRSGYFDSNMETYLEV